MTQKGKSQNIDLQKIFLILGGVAAFTTILMTVSVTTASITEINARIDTQEKILDIQSNNLDSKLDSEIGHLKEDLLEKDKEITKLRTQMYHLMIEIEKFRNFVN